MKKNQQTLVIQLHKLLTKSLPPSLRSLLSSSYVSLYYAGDSSSLFETINKCNDVVKSKDETTANKMCVNYIEYYLWLLIYSHRTALQCIGDLYRQHGRMVNSILHSSSLLIIISLPSSPPPHLLILISLSLPLLSSILLVILLY